jgi:aryl-alcohol dehydrogenase-like predicted oxidoreductase
VPCYSEGSWLETRRIGSLEVLLAGLGCNNLGMGLDSDRSARVIDAALVAGITFFDHVGRAAEDRLRRLNTDRIDLCQLS